MPAQDRTDLRRRLLAIAARQSGYFTAAQALDAGYSYPAQRYHAKRGNWLRVDRGIYRFPEWPTGPREDLVRWSLWSRGRAVVSRETATPKRPSHKVLSRAGRPFGEPVDPAVNAQPVTALGVVALRGIGVARVERLCRREVAGLSRGNGEQAAAEIGTVLSR